MRPRGVSFMFHVYILQNPDGRFYVGQTQDLTSRLSSHNPAGPCEGKFTRKNGPWSLVYHETYPTRSGAMRRERERTRPLARISGAVNAPDQVVAPRFAPPTGAKNGVTRRWIQRAAGGVIFRGRMAPSAS